MELKDQNIKINDKYKALLEKNYDTQKSLYDDNRGGKKVMASLDNPIGSCRHLYSKTISLVGMLASINKDNKGAAAKDDISEGEEDPSDGDLDLALAGNYSSTKPTMRRQDFYKE